MENACMAWYRSRGEKRLRTRNIPASAPPSPPSRKRKKKKNKVAMIFKSVWFPQLGRTSKKFEEEFEMKLTFKWTCGFCLNLSIGNAGRCVESNRDEETEWRRRRRKIHFFFSAQKLCVVHYSWRQDNESHKQSRGYIFQRNTRVECYWFFGFKEILGQFLHYTTGHTFISPSKWSFK
jgi:hypothetical protein